MSIDYDRSDRRMKALGQVMMLMALGEYAMASRALDMIREDQNGAHQGEATENGAE